MVASETTTKRAQRGHGKGWITLYQAREMAERNEPLPEEFYIDAVGVVQRKPIVKVRDGD